MIFYSDFLKSCLPRNEFEEFLRKAIIKNIYVYEDYKDHITFDEMLEEIFIALCGYMQSDYDDESVDHSWAKFSLDMFKEIVKINDTYTADDIYQKFRKFIEEW